MNSRMIVISKTLVNPTEGSALGALECYTNVPFNLTIVYACCAAREDDGGLTVDVNVDGVDTLILAIDADTAADPGEWKSTHVGGTAAPILVAAGSELEFDVNGAANANVVQVDLWCLMGEDYG